MKNLKKTSVWQSIYLQAKSSLGCHAHANIVKEQEKCMTHLQLLNSQKAGELTQFQNCVFFIVLSYACGTNNE